jgi:thermitase
VKSTSANLFVFPAMVAGICAVPHPVARRGDLMSNRTTRLFTSLAVGVAALATPTTAHGDDAELGPAVPGEFIVQLKSDGNIASVARDAGALATPDALGGTSGVYRLVLDPTADPAATLAMLTNVSGVDLAQPNFLTASTDHLARKRFFGDLPAAQVTTSASQYRLGQPGLGSAGLSGGMNATGIRVAVLDTGVDLAHPRLNGRLVPGGYDFIDRDAVPAEATNGRDDNGDGLVDGALGHGTYVSGLVALVAPGATILPIRVLDSDGTGSTWTTMQGIAYASAKGANVINVSLGGPASGDVAERQLTNVEAAGIIVVAAAGNSGSTTEVYPAAGPLVVGVTAVNGQTGQAASFANRGSWIDLAAPGVTITSLYPGGRFASWGGTSASSPIVAGAAALVAKARPGAQADDLVSALTSTARPDGLDGLSAYGRIDIAAAVAAARK